MLQEESRWPTLVTRLLKASQVKLGQWPWLLLASGLSDWWWVFGSGYFKGWSLVGDMLEPWVILVDVRPQKATPRLSTRSKQDMESTLLNMPEGRIWFLCRWEISLGATHEMTCGSIWTVDETFAQQMEEDACPTTQPWLRRFLELSVRESAPIPVITFL